MWRFDRSDFWWCLRQHHYLLAFSTCLFEMGNKFPKFFWSNKHELSKICPLSRHVVYFLSGSFKKYVKPIYRTPRLRITFFFTLNVIPCGDWIHNTQREGDRLNLTTFVKVVIYHSSLFSDYLLSSFTRCVVHTRSTNAYHNYLFKQKVAKKSRPSISRKSEYGLTSRLVVNRSHWRVNCKYTLFNYYIFTLYNYV